MKKRIYLVENDRGLAKSLAEAIEELSNAQVIGFSATESDACKWFEDHEFSWDLAVVDLYLDKGNGLHVIRRIRKTSTQKVVVLTNYATDTMREFCLSAGADEFFDKSAQLDEFIRYIGAAPGPRI